MARFELEIDTSKIDPALTSVRSKLAGVSDELNKAAKAEAGIVTGFIKAAEAAGKLDAVVSDISLPKLDLGDKLEREIAAVAIATEENFKNAANAVKFFKDVLTDIDPNTEEFKQITEVVRNLEAEIAKVGENNFEQDINDLTKSLQNLDKQGLQDTDTFRQMTQQLNTLSTANMSDLEKDFSRLSQTLNAQLLTLEKDSQAYKELEIQITTVNGVLGKLGRAENGLLPLRGRLKELKDSMSALSEAGLDGTAQFSALENKAGALADQFGDTSQRVKILASDTANIDFGVAAIQTGIGVIQIYEGALTTLGLSTEDVQKQTARLTALMNIANGVQQVANALNKDSILQVVGRDRATKALAAAQALYNSTIVTATGATRAFTIALAASGIGAVVVVIAALAVAYNKLSAASDEANKATERNNEVIKESAGSYAEAKVEIATMTDKIRLAKEGILDKNEVLAEYNDSLGKAIGSATSLSEAEQLIIDKGDEYIQIQFLKAKANAAAALASKELEKSLEAQNKSELEFAGLIDKAQLAVGDFIGSITGVGIRDQDIVDRALSNQKEQIVAFENNAESLLKIQESTIAEASKLAKKSGVILNPIKGVKADKDKAKKDAKKEVKLTLEEIEAELAKSIDEFKLNPSVELALKIQDLSGQQKKLKKEAEDAVAYTQALLSGRIGEIELGVPVKIEPIKTPESIPAIDPIPIDIPIEPSIKLKPIEEEIGSVNDLLRSGFQDIFGNVSDEEWQQIGETANVIAENVISTLNSVFDAQIAKQEELIASSEERLAELQDKLADEEEKQREGQASNVDLLKKQIADEKKVRDKAQKDLEEAQKKRQLVDDAQQISSIITAAANIIVGWSTVPLVGSILGIAAVGAMIAAFIAAKTTAQKGFYEGGYTGDGNPRSEAGVVHKREWVTDHETTAAHRPLLEGLHTANRSKLIEGLRGAIDQYKIAPDDLFLNQISEANNQTTTNTYLNLQPLVSLLTSMDSRLSTIEKESRKRITPLGDGRILVEDQNSKTIQNI